MSLVLDVDDCDRLEGFLEGLQLSVRKEIQKWELTMWEEVIEDAEQVGGWGGSVSNTGV